MPLEADSAVLILVQSRGRNLEWTIKKGVDESDYTIMLIPDGRKPTIDKSPKRRWCAQLMLFHQHRGDRNRVIEESRVIQ